MIGTRLHDIAFTLARHAGEIATRLVLGWLRWFWQLSVGGKIFATGCEIIILYLLSQRLLSSPRASREIVDVGSIALGFLLVFAVLFAGARPR